MHDKQFAAFVHGDAAGLKNHRRIAHRLAA